MEQIRPESAEMGLLMDGGEWIGQCLGEVGMYFGAGENVEVGEAYLVRVKRFDSAEGGVMIGAAGLGSLQFEK
jgi:hypothetical protein